MVQNNPVIVVTGSTRGIGRGLAESFLDRGCRTVVTGRSPATVDRAVGELSDRFGAELVGGCPVDVTDIEQLRTLWSDSVDHFGRVDIWINNAGASAKRKPLWEQTAEEISTVVDTNLTGLLLASKVALEGMVAQSHGALWNMEGFGSNNEAQTGMAAYGATKRAVKYLNKALQKDVEGTGVLVNTLSPGIVATDLLIDDYDHTSEEWAKAKKIFNILGDDVQTVTPWLAEKVLAADKTGQRVAWLTKRKAAGRFMTASFNKRELFDA